jgi:hypothetical protein
MKSAGNHGSWSLLFTFIMVMVWHFVRDSVKLLLQSSYCWMCYSGDFSLSQSHRHVSLCYLGPRVKPKKMCAHFAGKQDGALCSKKQSWPSSTNHVSTQVRLYTVTIVGSEMLVQTTGNKMNASMQFGFIFICEKHSFFWVFKSNMLILKMVWNKYLDCQNHSSSWTKNWLPKSSIKTQLSHSILMNALITFYYGCFWFPKSLIDL